MDWMGCASLWLAAGIVGHLMVESQAKKRGEPYTLALAIFTYVLGPPLLVLAFLFALGKGLAHLFRRR